MDHTICDLLHLLLIRIFSSLVHMVVCTTLLPFLWMSSGPLSVTVSVYPHYIYYLLFICLIKQICSMDVWVFTVCFLQCMLLWVVEHAYLRAYLKIFHVYIWENIIEMKCDSFMLYFIKNRWISSHSNWSCESSNFSKPLSILIFFVFKINLFFVFFWGTWE